MMESLKPLKFVVSPRLVAPTRAGAADLLGAVEGLMSESTPSVHADSPSDHRGTSAVSAVIDLTDRSLHAVLARFTGGLSPAALMQAYSDWAVRSKSFIGCQETRRKTLARP
jgi:polyhydroxyalkanoate synthase